MVKFEDIEEDVREVLDMIYYKSEDVQTIIEQINSVLKLLEEYFHKMLEQYNEKQFNDYIDILMKPIYSMLEIIHEINSSSNQYDENDSNKLKQAKITLLTAVRNTIKQIDKDVRKDDILHHIDKEDRIFFKEEIEGIQQEHLKRYVENASLMSILNAETIMNEFEKIWNKEKIIDQLFDVIDNNDIDFGDKKITKAFLKFLVLFHSQASETKIQHYIEGVSDFPKEFEIALKTKTDKRYIINKKEKYLDTKIGIDPKLKIGIEIETNSKLPYYFTYKISSDIISSQDIIRQKWRAYLDASVGHNQGSEFVSTIFHDTTSEISEIGALIETINELGFYSEKGEMLFNTAGQINIGIDYLDSKEAVLNFLEIYGNSEELLYHICTPNGELLRGFGYAPYATEKFAPISAKLSKMVVKDEMTREDVIDLATKVLGLKHGSISLRDKNRFEFRMFNGTVILEDWINNIRLCGKMIQISKELADIELNDERTPDEENKLKLKEKLKTENMTLEDKLEVFLDLMFDDEAEKHIYKERFFCLKKKLLETTGKGEYDRQPRESFGKLLFGRVELKNRERTALDQVFKITDFENNYTANIKLAIISNASGYLYAIGNNAETQHHINASNKSDKYADSNVIGG